MTRIGFRFDVLPSEVFTLLLRFLMKQDLLSLSHVDRVLFRELLGPNSVVWQSRVPTPPFAGNAKWTALLRATNKPQTLKALYHHTVASLRRALLPSETSLKMLYFTSLSLSFLGTPTDRTHCTEVLQDLRIPPRVCVSWTPHSFSLDVGFVVSQESHHMGGGFCSGGYGGALLSSTTYSGRQSQGHAYIEIRSDQLSCSMVDNGSGPPVIARGLVTDRWYHLALSFDRNKYEGHGGEQRVYLDGELIHTTVGPLHPAWLAMSTKRIGIMHRGEVGWVTFNGVVDDFRLWTGVLSANDVAAMQQGGWSPPREAVCSWSLKQDGEVDLKYGMVRFVRCMRPLEDRAYRQEKVVKVRVRRTSLPFP